MKTHLLISLLIWFVSLGEVMGESVIVSNSKGFNANPVVDAGGLPLAGSDPVIVALGTFASEPSVAFAGSEAQVSSSLYQGLLSEFTQFGSMGTLLDPIAPLNLLGVFDFQDRQDVAGTLLDGKNAYLIIAKGSDLANATEVAILRIDKTFDASSDDSVFPSVVTVGTSSGTTVIVGSESLFQGVATSLDPSNQAAYSLAALSASPALAVEYPEETVLENGNFTAGYGIEVVGALNGAFTPIIRNTGGADLENLMVEIVGVDSGDWILDTTGLNTTVPPGGQTSVTVSFLPMKSGSLNAILRITSSDVTASPFDILLSGLALAFDEDGDSDGLNDASEWRLRDLGFDWQVQQLALVNTLFANAEGAGLFTKSQLQALRASSPLIERDPLTGFFTFTVDWKKSEDLMTFDDFPVELGDLSVNGAGDVELLVDPDDDAAFFRFEVE